MAPTPARATRLLLAVAAVVAGATAAAGFAATSRTTPAARGGGLAGTWSGTLSGSAGGSVRRERIVIVVNARETAGSWSVGPTCHGTLSLDGISGGYHHYRRRAARGASCLGGDVDCLRRVGGGVYDTVTARPGGYARAGTLRRARSG